MKKIILFIFLFSLVKAGFAQTFTLTAASGDCSGALKVTDTVVIAKNSPKGVGKTLEMYYFNNYEGEKNSVWYKITVPEDCYLAFDLVPFDIADDYDFALYKYTGNETNFCNKILKQQLAPVREIISEDDPRINSRTGLTVSKTRISIPPGPGESYGNAPKVKKDEVYYLLVNNVEYGKGHTITFHFRIPKPEPEVDITIVDSETGKPIKADINVAESSAKMYPPKDSVYKITNESELEISADFSKNYTISVFSKGYFTCVKKVTTTDSVTKTTLKIELKKIVKGASVILENIYFESNTAVILPESYTALELLAGSMKQNPTLKIEIQGHVNWINDWKDKADTTGLLALSKERAKAVYDYLLTKSVTADRMTYKGYGNTKMIYPEATTLEEQEKNRRVEIKVTSYSQ
jgi:outer membrane protein OmpA-like peptidoglycan-associated protein